MSEYDLAKQIFSRAFPQEILVPQSIELWQGDFPLPDALARYYRELGAFNVNIDAYGNSFFLPSLAKLWDYQAGYRYHHETNERFEGWDDDWLVIADEGADPFIYSRESGRVLHDVHGQGVWQPSEMFMDVPAMVTTLAILGEIVAKAGEDFVDEDDYVDERFANEAKEKLGQVLGSKSAAEAVLHRLGWLR